MFLNKKHIVKYFTLLTMALCVSACGQTQSSSVMATFPTIPAQTLSRQDVVFPDVLQGKYGFIAVAFKQKAQSQIDTWYALYQDSLQSRGVVFYEIPMISGSWNLVSGWIDNGMRSGIPAEKHPYVATYYGPLEDHQARLGVDNDQLAYVYLIDPEGKILFRGKNIVQPGDAEKLLSAWAESSENQH